MSRLMRLFYYGTFGAIGGLIGWQISNLLGLSIFSNLYLSEVVAGGLIGASIGFLIGLGEGVLSKNLVLGLKSCLSSGLLGMAGGSIGLPIAEGFFLGFGGGDAVRLIGWGIFGLLIGLAAGITSGTQLWKGGLGGFLGGIFGGILLSVSRELLDDPLLGKAAGLILLGASIGVCTALIVYLLSRSWLEVKSGKLAGMEFILDKFLKPESPAVFIGSDAFKAELVLPDPDIAPQHAMIKGHGTHYQIKDMSLSGTFINKKKIETAQLKNNQAILVGNTELVYHEKR